MPAFSKDDIKDWGLPKLREEHGKALDRVQSIREENDGTLVNVSGEKAIEVKNLMETTNLIGEQIDELKFLDDADAQTDEHTKRREAKNRPPVPGGKGDDTKKKEGPTDIGGQFIKSEAWKAFKSDGKKDVTVRLDLGAVFKGYQGIGEVPTKALFDSGDFPTQPDFLAVPVSKLFQPNNIASLMAQGTTSKATLRYPVENVVATGAAATAEGAAKPEAEINFTPTDEPVRKIAVTLPLTDEVLDDEEFLRAYINARLRLFVQNEEDRQVLVGSGVAPNITGIMNRAGVDVSTSYSIAGANADQALIDSVFRASMRVRESFLTPDAFIARAATWQIMRLAKDGNRNYLLGPPSEDAPVRLWGIRGVLNENMPAQVATNKPVLVGAFEEGAMFVRRSEIELAMTDSHATDFTENKIRLRAEERAGLAVWRPASFAAVTSAA